MRILFCNYEYPPLGGGGGAVTALLAQELAKRHEITVLTSQALGLPSQSIDSGVHVIRVPVLVRRQQAAANLASMFAYMVMATRLGKKHLKDTTYDVINTHFVLPSGPVGDALAGALHVPNVLSVHGGDLYDPSKWTSPHRHRLLRTWVRMLLRRADQVVAQSRNTLENVQRFYTPELEPLRIPLGIKRPCDGTADRDLYGFREDDVLLVTVGRLVSRKAIGQLMVVLDNRHHQNVRLLIVGSGPEEQRLREQARQMNVAERTHFFGHVKEAEKCQILRMADIFVSTSQHEGFGLVFLEAMACGLPVVCYDHGGQTDFLESEATGYLVPLNDTSEFYRCCHALILDPMLRKNTGARNLERVEKYYIDVCAQQYEAVFMDVVETRRKECLVDQPRRS